MTNAHYHYQIAQTEGVDFLLIVDENRGGTSVTNVIEEVVAEISHKESIDPKHHVILYQDSEGVWDGWSPKNGFFHIGAFSSQEARNRYLERTAQKS